MVIVKYGENLMQQINQPSGLYGLTQYQKGGVID